MRTNFLRLTAIVTILLVSATNVSASRWVKRSGGKSGGGLAGKSRIELGFGVRNHADHVHSSSVWDDSEVTASSGSIGNLSLSHWENDNIAYNLSYTIHDVEYDSWTDDWGYEAHETTVVQSLMFGLRYYMPQSRPYSTFRPYLSASAGAFIGTEEYGEEDECECESYSETHSMTVAGARLGGGIDFLMGRNFALGFTAAYNFAEDFPRAIGGRDNYSGSELGISFSYLFGGRGR